MVLGKIINEIRTLFFDSNNRAKIEETGPKKANFFPEKYRPKTGFQPVGIIAQFFRDRV